METKKQIINSIAEALKSSKDFSEIMAEVKPLKAAFVELAKSQVDELKKEHEASESEEPFKVPHEEEDGRFAELMADFNQRKAKWDEQKLHEQNQNLEIKKKILESLDKLITEENHIGPAFEKFNELKEKWRNTGPVPNTEYKDLQREYSHQIERFFYNINIYKTLKEYDLQKNLQLKLELIKKVEDLLKNESIKEVRDLIGLYTQEWDEVGPTHQNQWEKVRDDFWENVRNVHKKIADHFKLQKEKIKGNLEEKEKVCERLEALVNNDFSDIKHWNRAQKEMHQIQDDWKKIGFAGKKTNDEIWKRFKTAMNAFYEKGKSQKEAMKEVFKTNEDRKLRVIERAESMKDSMDWKNTADEYKRLQSDWKRIGPSHPAKEQKLWKKFREASDYFFARRKDYFDNREDREKQNLEKKKELLKKLDELKVAKSKDEMAVVQKMAKEWNVIGYVPKDEKNKIENDFQKILSSKMKDMGLDNKEIESQSYELKIEGFKDADNAAELLRNEYNHLDEKLKKIEADIKQYENNLGFFGGNTNSPLVKEVVEKIETSKKEVIKIRAKMGLIEK